MPYLEVNDRRRHKNEQVAFDPTVQMVLKEITKNRDIAEQGHFVARFGDFVLEQSTNGQCISAPDQDVGFQRARVDDRAADRCTREYEGGISDFVADFRLHLQGDKVVLIDAGRNDERVAELFVLESTEDGGGRLFVEVQLRNGLRAIDLNLRLQIVSGHNPRIGEEFCVVIFI